MKFARIALLVSGLTGSMLSLSAHAADPVKPTAADFAAMAQCKTLQTKYPSLVGKDVVVGLGGYTKGFEAPSAADPTVIEGLDPSLFDRLGGCLGFKHTYQNGSFNVLLTSISSGRADIGPMLYVTPERLKQIAFVASVQVQDGSVIAKGNPKKINTIDDLCGKTVAAAAGTYEASKLVPEQSARCVAAGKPEVNMLMVQNTDNSIQAIKSGRADIYLTEAGSAREIAKADPASYATAFTVDLPIMVGFPIAKDNAVMRSAVLDAMLVIQQSGAQQKLLDYWGQGASAQRTATDKG
ncbi:polar amino acid transport system substrate-binding protein [Erwinia toletana]|uniref:Polar amino acid transport system substrate-binding protein n=1 Tax=Winslowiella toletana TaxID=92490 RepID=A0ABS4PA07_9GAMM|nr:transporter substrate-binding domain-containing protein [Winslowiella toletana]MBP2168955.1 polar amino acid transport system substrate-binding protein [Winslowiella toletana]